MEDTLGEGSVSLNEYITHTVLILVLMEDTLGDHSSSSWHDNYRLNPCSNGRYSRRSISNLSKSMFAKVLILVLMEDTLGENY